MTLSKRLQQNFFKDDVVEVAKKLIGKLICRKFEDGTIKKFRINETEAYAAPDDAANHYNSYNEKKKSQLNIEKGLLYLYICYGIYWMVNVTAGQGSKPEGCLIRGIETAPGPGRTGARLEVSKSMHGIDLTTSDIIWIEDDGNNWDYISTPRVGIDYAPEPWLSKPWRFYHETEESRKYASRLGKSKPKKKKKSDDEKSSQK
ncbi:hypothetical protein TVAG_489150 [Trichomonas vaginalis G3]|uniref:DNA-3-methyladenine glycosylase II n=1 Tax=Trichomonas vaginalis (strain ATCC PRA-98 / G3) TaxID=412133 RepID=A2EVC5_TRIV3|nr:DNA-7-methyladenine glycosylase protein [Trichomonas vaginalis G3]EAY03371.1 hypothetical protein TVAG_489150 [Trichomonas vaginalis G3]KAI5538099.1 DNA-7-methyladenine glycosylase protein [Trichomonas vaginalis G3]|eukprot:XP_001315594.1 hypothetical protein [Trichomonas vaginalis G3]